MRVFFLNFFFYTQDWKKEKEKKKHFCISAEICILASIGRNGLERIGMDRNLGQDGMGGFLSRFAYWYEKFRLFRPERSKIDNYDLTKCYVLIDNVLNIEVIDGFLIKEYWDFKNFFLVTSFISSSTQRLSIPKLLKFPLNILYGT